MLSLMLKLQVFSSSGRKEEKYFISTENNTKFSKPINTQFEAVVIFILRVYYIFFTLLLWVNIQLDDLIVIFNNQPTVCIIVFMY